MPLHLWDTFAAPIRTRPIVIVWTGEAHLGASPVAIVTAPGTARGGHRAVVRNPRASAAEQTAIQTPQHDGAQELDLKVINPHSRSMSAST
jgi:hypothetical protein